MKELNETRERVMITVMKAIEDQVRIVAKNPQHWEPVYQNLETLSHVMEALAFDENKL